MLYTTKNVPILWYVVPFLLLVVLGISGCNTNTTHQTYLYHGPGGFETDYYAGSSLSVQWHAQPGQIVTDSSPMPLVLKVSLIGPFRQIDDVLGAIRKYKNDPVLNHMGPIVATTTPIRTDNWTSKTFTSTISFPATLQPGYYTLALMVSGDTVTRENAVIRIRVHV